VFLQVPLSVDAITSLLNMDRSLGSNLLEPFRPVIHLPAAGPVSIFHASFHDFVVTPSRCEKHSLNVFEGHRLLAVQSLRCLNSSLKHNICNLDINVNYSPSDEPHAIHDSLRYACVHWASHLVHVLERAPVDDSLHDVQDLISGFLDKHLLHWFECLSALRELGPGINSLNTAKEAISVGMKLFAGKSID
jgi:hypothetical protein